MIILTSLVNKGYTEELLRGHAYKHISYFYRDINRKYDATFQILTNLPDGKIEGLEDVGYIPIEYPRYVWSYVDKIFYSFKLSYELNEDVLWVDFDKFGKFRYDILNVLNNILPRDRFIYDVPWCDEGKRIFGSTRESASFRMFLDRENVSNETIEPLMEQIFYIPKGMVTHDMLRDIELAKPVLEHGSFVGGYPYKTPDGYPSMGNGEGIILGYLISKYNLPTATFKNE